LPQSGAGGIYLRHFPVRLLIWARWSCCPASSTPTAIWIIRTWRTFPPPKIFTDWLKLITTTKAEWAYSEFASSWLAGAEMLLRTGTTTVGDIENVPELLPDVWEATPLRVVSLLK